MSQSDPLRTFTPKPGSATREPAVDTTKVKPDGLDRIRHFFEDESVSDIYSKENLGSESYTQPGHPCHGGYEDSSNKDKP